MGAEVRNALSPVLVVAAWLPWAATLSAEETTVNFVIAGTSTVRAWSCPARGLLKFTMGKSAPAVPGFPHGLDRVVVVVPVTAIECEEPEMRDHLRQTLNAKLHPEILYQQDRYTVVGPDGATTAGRLTLNGVTRPVSLNLKLTSSPEGLHVSGETVIDMVEYKVTPPNLWLGLLKVGKDVRVRFDATLKAGQ